MGDPTCSPVGRREATAHPCNPLLVVRVKLLTCCPRLTRTRPQDTDSQRQQELLGLVAAQRAGQGWRGRGTCGGTWCSSQAGAASQPGLERTPPRHPPREGACVCARVCVLESLLLGGFQALQAQSTNLCLIKTALCNITYMSLHLTPMVPRKAQAPFQPPGCVPPGQISQGHGTVGQELGCVSVWILPPSREAQWGFA